MVASSCRYVFAVAVGVVFVCSCWSSCCAGPGSVVAGSGVGSSCLSSCSVVVASG